MWHLLVETILPPAPDGCQRPDARAPVKKDLARFKVPRDVRFVDELPRTSTGKVLRRELTTD